MEQPSRNEIVANLIGTTVISITHKYMSGEIILHTPNNDVYVAPAGGADIEFTGTGNGIARVKVNDIKNSVIEDAVLWDTELELVFEDGTVLNLFDPTGGEGLDIWYEEKSIKQNQIVRESLL